MRGLPIGKPVEDENVNGAVVRHGHIVEAEDMCIPKQKLISGRVMRKPNVCQLNARSFGMSGRTGTSASGSGQFWWWREILWSDHDIMDDGEGSISAASGSDKHDHRAHASQSTREPERSVGQRAHDVSPPVSVPARRARIV